MDPRHTLLTFLFEASQEPYVALMKRSRRPWGRSNAALLAFEEGSLGRALGEHLEARGLALMDRLEDHDVFHLLTGIGTDVPSEVELSFFLLGNGKPSLYLVGVTALGGLLFPELAARFVQAFTRGARCAPIWSHDLEPMLPRSLASVRALLGPNAPSEVGQGGPLCYHASATTPRNLETPC